MPFICFLKRVIYGKSKWSAVWLHYISIALKLAYNKNKPYKPWTIDPEINSMLGFLEKGLGIASPTHFVYGFSTKLILMLYSIN